MNKELKTKLKKETSADGVGAVVGLLDQGEVSYEKFGNDELNKDTFFEIGSLTKTFTALLLLILKQEKVLSLNDTASGILKATEFSDSRVGSITLEELVLHTSGLPRLPDNINPDDVSNPYVDYLEEDLLTFLSNYELDEGKKGGFNYSNLGYGLLGYLMEQATGKEYEKLIQEYIAKPLGMKDTYVQLPEEKEDRMATGHDEKGIITQRWHNGVLIGDGGLVSTTSDLVIFLEAQLKPSTAKYTKSIQDSHDITDKAEADVAYGWMVRRSDTSSVYWRSGKTGGYSSFWGFNKSRQKGIVFLANGRIDQDIAGKYLVN